MQGELGLLPFHRGCQGILTNPQSVPLYGRDGLVRCAGDQDARTNALVLALDASGGVHRVADRREVEPGRRADGAEQYRPGMYPIPIRNPSNPYRVQIARLSSMPRTIARAERTAAGVVRPIGDHPEEDHQAITEELVDDPALGLELGTTTW